MRSLTHNIAPSSEVTVNLYKPAGISGILVQRADHASLRICLAGDPSPQLKSTLGSMRTSAGLSLRASEFQNSACHSLLPHVNLRGAAAEADHNIVPKIRAESNSALNFLNFDDLNIQLPPISALACCFVTLFDLRRSQKQISLIILIYSLCKDNKY